jgi:Na+/proline symporter
MAATLLFNVAHYALRPWPWILVALASVIVFPDLESMRQAFSGVDPALVKNDFAYPAMLSRLPNGFLGLVVTSLIAAYMSTVSTHLNWGSSYIVNDVYLRFFKPHAGDKELVLAGRLSTVGLMIVSALFTLLLSNALQAFQIVLQIGAGTGLIFILRWFWWRINAYTEIAAMIISFAVALFFQFGYAHTGLPPIGEGLQLVVGVAVTTVGWLAVAFLTPVTDPAILREFCRRIQPGGPGWRRVMDEARRDGEELDDGPGAWDVPLGLLAMGVGCVMVYSMLFAVGKFIYGELALATVMAVVAAVATGALVRIWPRLRFR